MKAFTELYGALDQTNATNAKIEAMVDYFGKVPAADAAWAVYFLTGRRLKRLIKRAELRSWVLSATGQPEWLLEETYRHVGDMAETIALLLPEPETNALEDCSLSGWVEDRLIPLPTVAAELRAERVQQWWRTLPDAARFTLNKLLTGALRVGVSQRLVIRALAAHFGLPSAVLAHRLMGEWQPGAHWFNELGNPDTTRVSLSTPYPFYLASPLPAEPVELGARTNWQVEWKWDGIRAQLIHRQGQVFIWSRGEELLTDRFPEVRQAASTLPEGSVLDGELLAWQGDAPLPFAALQRRIGKLKPGATLLREVPVVFLAYDLLEYRGRDVRSDPLQLRRTRLAEMLIADGDPVRVSPEVSADSWDALRALREESRARGVEGFMLKDRRSSYGVGRTRGAWWKWKIDPLTIDAALIYAQPGSGRRSNLFTDYTFAVWQGEPNASNLVPVCKAYSGLNNEEIAELDRWIRRHTKERFGPVRSVEPLHVFEIAFEGIAPSSRHKSGVALRFPRIARWRRDLSLADVDTLPSVSELLEVPEPASAQQAR